MDRRAFLGTAVAGTLAAGARTAAGDTPARKPNVIFAFSDEHRWHSMNFSEMPELHTPHMAALATQGTEFVQCISNYPVCSPYRGMFLSGRWPFHTGIIDNDLPLDKDQWMLGKAFRDAGYRTAYIGKWHLVGTRAEPFGFDHSLIWTGTNAHWDTSEFHPADGQAQKPKGYNATLMTDQALDFIRASKEQPFFLALSWNPPHANFLDPPKEKLALYPEETTLTKRTNYHSGEGENPSGSRLIWKQNDWPHYQGYHAHISAIDDELGRLMRELDELGIADDTILVYTSDHGSMMGSHGLGGKRQPYEESIRVPFIVRWPGHFAAGKKCDALFGTIDIAPTLCGMAGIGAPAFCDGQDFSPHCRGNDGPRPDSQFIMHIAKEKASGGNAHPAPIFRGVRTAQHTFAVMPDGNGFLFDNAADSYQQRNLFGSEEAEPLTRQLLERTRQWQRAAGENVWKV